MENRSMRQKHRSSIAAAARRVTAGLGLACALMLQVGCGETAVVPADVAARDSAGVVVVDVESLASVAAPTASLELVFSTAATGVELFGVTAARVLDDGRIAVANAGNQEVLLLTPSGTLSRTAGRAGLGPGEFRTITTLHRSPGGGFSAYDARSGRWTSFDQSGDLASTVQMNPPNSYTDLEPLAVGADGQVLAIYGSLRRMPAEGIRRDTSPLLVFHSPRTAPDTLSLWATSESLFALDEGGGWSSTRVGFGPSLASFGANQWLVIGDTDRLEVHLVAVPGESVMVIRGGSPPVPTADADGEAWRRERVARLRSDLPAELREQFVERLGRAPFRESYPAFDKLAVDVTGRVWIGASAGYRDSERRWVVFGQDGGPVATLRLPVDTEILDVTTTHVLTLSRTDLDIEVLSSWEVTGIE